MNSVNDKYSIITRVDDLTDIQRDKLKNVKYRSIKVLDDLNFIQFTYNNNPKYSFADYGLALFVIDSDDSYDFYGFNNKGSYVSMPSSYMETIFELKVFGRCKHKATLRSIDSLAKLFEISLNDAVSLLKAL